MLEMGEPVSILGLARSMIRLSGRTEGYDASIEITGMRPGEKLHEELAAPEEEPMPTAVDKVMLLCQGDIGPVLTEAEETIRSLWTEARDMGDGELREWLFKVPGVVREEIRDELRNEVGSGRL